MTEAGTGTMTNINFLWMSSNKSPVWVNISVEDTVDTVEGFFSDTILYLNTFSKYFIIQYAYKYGASMIFNNK